MRVTVIFSGGKDSCLATWYALHQGWHVSSLLVMEPPDIESYMFHYPGVKWTHLQGQALSIPVRSFAASSGKNTELDSLRDSLRELKKREHLDGLVSGAVESGYQKRKIDMICDELDLISHAPLWHKDPELLLREILDLGFETYIIGASALGLDESWIGKKLDEKSILELKNLQRKNRIHLSGEGGEYETFVTNACFFRKRIVFVKTSKHWSGSSGHLIIFEAELASKR